MKWLKTIHVAGAVSHFRHGAKGESFPMRGPTVIELEVLEREASGAACVRRLGPCSYEIVREVAQ